MLIELNVESDLRFPTRKTIEKILQDLDTDYHGWANTNNYVLASRFFPIRQTTDTEIKVAVLQNSHKYGMTYFHAPGTDPRTWSMNEGVTAYESTWRGAHFKEGLKFGEVEILELASMAPGIRNRRISERISEGLANMIERRKRRLEWLAAQVLTKGQIVVSQFDPDNPEKLSYTVDYQFDNFNLPITDFTSKTAGVSDHDPVKWAIDLKNAALDDPVVPGKYRPVELLVTSSFARVLRENTKFWDAWRGYNNESTTQTPTPLYFYSDEYILDAYSRMTGLKVTVYDGGYLDANGTFFKFITDGQLVVIYEGAGPLAEFVMTAHAHTDGNRLELGTGPYVVVDDGRKKPNPYYAIFHGFHGLPRMLDYDPKTLKCHRVKTMAYYPL